MQEKIVIVGGVAGGATAAARARRLNEQAEIVLFERGEYISFANCGLPYYIGGTIEDREDLLVTTEEEFKKRYRIDVRCLSEVEKVDRECRTVTVVKHPTGEIYQETYDKLILAPGAAPFRPKVIGIDNEMVFTLRTLADADAIKSYINQKRPVSAVVVGGGFIGLEMVENLEKCGLKVKLIEKQDQILPQLDYEMAAVVRAHLDEKGVQCELGSGLVSIDELNNRLCITTDKSCRTECDMLILAVGIRPENVLGKMAGLDLCPRGHVKVTSSMITSDPHIYAVGDAICINDFILGTLTATALAGPANKQARIAADNVMGRDVSLRGCLGTSIVKIFDLTAAATGLNEKILKEQDVPYLVSYTHSESHASYYPGAERMAIKMIFAPTDGRILGAQIVGGEGVDKRIDVLATAIRGRLGVADLEELELAYAPPYSSAKDPVNVAGLVAHNILKGDMQIVTWQSVRELPEDHVLIDLREKSEIDETGYINGAVHIPLDDLRDMLPELDRNKTYVVYCAVGLRGYIAYRILVQRGFKAKNLSGGYTTYASS